MYVTAASLQAHAESVGRWPPSPEEEFDSAWHELAVRATADLDRVADELHTANARLKELEEENERLKADRDDLRTALAALARLVERRSDDS